MKKHLIHFLIGLFLAFTFGLITSCSSQLPAQRYAREHRHREFQGWDKENKKMDQDAKRRPREHQKKNKW